MSEATANQHSVELMTELLEAGVHYGHQTKRWNPKMRDYILEEKNSIYIIDLGLTVEQIDSATQYLRDLVRNGGKVLFVGTKKQAQGAIAEAAEATGQFYVNQRWLGGTLTNLTTIRRSVARLKEIQALEKSPAFAKINKAEASSIRREGAKLLHNLGGIAEMARGRYLGGATDGMADKIPARIGGKQEAKLSHGEFVIPADVVGHLGNGNSEAGAQRLYAMMDKIRKARTGTTKQGKQINPDKFLA